MEFRRSRTPGNRVVGGGRERKYTQHGEEEAAMSGGLVYPCGVSWIVFSSSNLAMLND